MYSLSIIKQLNATPRPKHESETTRHCSFSGTAQKGIVLHSAKKRSAVFLAAGTPAREFLACWHSTNSAIRRDAYVEAYF